MQAQSLDAAARKVIEDAGFGPGYRYFTHRVGHGIGMDGHEWTYLVRGNTTPLRPGMCFSDDRHLHPGRAGIRHEDIITITETGASNLAPGRAARRIRPSFSKEKPSDRRPPSLIATLVLALAFLGWPAPAPAQPAATDPEVVKGIRQVEDGDYDDAIVTLDGAVRRLAADRSHPADLPQAYLYLGIAYVGKGHDAAAKAKFREALKQLKDLSLSADKFPPKVINVFETARDEVNREAAASSAGTPAAAAPDPESSAASATIPGKKGGGGSKALIVLGVLGAGAGVALAAGGGGGNGGSGASGPPPGSAATTTHLPERDRGIRKAARDFVVDVRGTGTLTARVDWLQDGVLLDMYIVNLANPGQVIATGNQTASKQRSLSTAVTAGSYRIAVTNSTGAGPEVTTTFTLVVTHP